MIRLFLLAVVPLAPVLHFAFGLPAIWVFAAGVLGHRRAGRLAPGGDRAAREAHGPGGRRPALGQPGQPGGADPGHLRADARRGGGGARPDHRLDHRHQPARPGPGDRGGRRHARAPGVPARARGPAVQPVHPGGDRAAAAGGVRLHRPPRPARERPRGGRGGPQPAGLGAAAAALRRQPRVHAGHPPRRLLQRRGGRGGGGRGVLVGVAVPGRAGRDDGRGGDGERADLRRAVGRGRDAAPLAHLRRRDPAGPGGHRRRPVLRRVLRPPGPHGPRHEHLHRLGDPGGAGGGAGAGDPVLAASAAR